MSALIAGAPYRGQFQERLQAVTKETANAPIRVSSNFGKDPPPPANTPTHARRTWYSGVRVILGSIDILMGEVDR